MNVRTLAPLLLVVSPYLVRVLAACDASCPVGDIPASCPDAGSPSYVSDVAPIISQQCTACHSPGGVEPSSPLGTYGDVFSRRQAVLDQIYACQMPQGTSLTPSQRATLLQWFACGAPNN